MHTKFDFDIDLYIYIQDEKNYIFTIKDCILETELQNFLKEIYPQIYSDSSDYNGVLQKLKLLNTKEIIEYAKSNIVFWVYKS